MRAKGGKEGPCAGQGAVLSCIHASGDPDDVPLQDELSSARDGARRKDAQIVIQPNAGIGSARARL